MNKSKLMVERYIRPNGTLNFANYNADITFWVTTCWQRSAKENAEVLDFYASLWKNPKLVHKGALEKVAEKKKPVEPKAEVKPEPKPEKNIPAE